MSDDTEGSAAMRGSLAWIPVTDGLPECDVAVLVWCRILREHCMARMRLIGLPGRDQKLIWHSSDEDVDGVNVDRDGVVSHWLPLPAPPTDAK